jgi:hypothetical protein
MPGIVALDNEFVTVGCGPGSGIVHHEMHRFVVSAMFRQALETGLQLMKTHRASKWLSDDRRNGAISNDDVAWARKSWRPRAIAAGFRTWAMVLPESVVGSMRTRRIVEDARRSGITVEIFDDPAGARSWLEGQPGQKASPRR